jgi:hypothetical protein
MGGRWKIGTENIQPKIEERKCVREGRFCLSRNIFKGKQRNVWLLASYEI